jgi:glycosyltransferase involved in cell wall biosynthesis
MGADRTDLALARIPVAARGLDEYAEFLPPDELWRTTFRARRLEGLRVLHLSLPPWADDMADGLGSLVAVERGLGLDSHWLVLDDVHDVATSVMAHPRWPDGSDDWWEWGSRNVRVARALTTGWDVAVVHGPALAGVAAMAPEKADRWIWQPSSVGAPDPTSRGAAFLDAYDCTLRLQAAPGDRIDPLRFERAQLHPDAGASTLARIGVEPGERLILHATRFGTWHGVAPLLAACARRRPATGVIVAAGPPPRSSGGDFVDYAQVRSVAEQHDRVVVVSGLPAPALWRLRARAQLVIRSAEPRGRALDVAEARWQATPIVAHGDASRSTSHAGVVVGRTPAAIADHVSALLDAPARAAVLGLAGHRTLRRHGLVIHGLIAWLDVLTQPLAATAPQ